MVKVLKEFFFSEIVNQPIYDAEGDKVGRVRDFAVRWDGLIPRVTGIKYAKGVSNLIAINQIGSWDRKGIRLKSSFRQDSMNPLQEDEIYVGKWLLDKQIIDLKGSRLVRVNDIQLSWVDMGINREIVMVAADAGTSGILRRLGLGFLVKNRGSYYVSWQDIKPLKSRTANLQLSKERDLIYRLHPEDLADIIEDMNRKDRHEFINALDDATAAEVLSETGLDTQVNIFKQLDSNRASDILEEMAPDEAADILGELSEEKSSELLNLMDPEEAEDVRELLQYPDGTAGALMTTEFISLEKGLTVQETIQKLRELAPSTELIYYLYILDEREVLVGVLSLRELIIAQPDSRLADLMSTRVITVNHFEDHAAVLELVGKYNLLALPVVDDNGAMVGVITIDDVLANFAAGRARF